ncbi:MAG: radical SAM protein [Candidatus Moraniibacteriota bacterium]
MGVLEKQELFRVIDPAFGRNNIYRHQATQMVSLGPVMIATVVDQNIAWLTAEVINENNYRRRLGAPIGQDELPNHLVLQKSRRALFVGISASMTNAVPRAKEIIKAYLDMPENLRPKYIIVGGWHAGDSPIEFLELGKNVIVVHGEGEHTIIKLFTALRDGLPLSSVPGISYWEDGVLKRNGPRFPIILQEDMDNLPIPDFGLVRYAKIKIYPLQSTRGCSGKCRFCRVRSIPRFISPQRFQEIFEIVLSHGARKFFFVDDRSEEDLAGFRERLKKLIRLRERRGLKFEITTQNRLSLGEDDDTLKLMSEAGVDTVAVGCESPIPEELEAMKKPIDPKKMIMWVKAFAKHGLNLHMMLIFGYPMPKNMKGPLRDKKGKLLPAKKRASIFWSFIKKAKPATLQVLFYTPIPGTLDWYSLEKQGRIRKDISWEFYDGLHLVFVPDEGLDPNELQKAVESIMQKFYAFRPFWMFERFSLFLHLIRIGLVTILMPLIWIIELPISYRPGFTLEKWFRSAWQKPKRLFKNSKIYFKAQWIIIIHKKNSKFSDFKAYWSQLVSNKKE